MIIRFFDKNKCELGTIRKKGVSHRKEAKEFISQNREVAYYTTTEIRKIPKKWRKQQ